MANPSLVLFTHALLPHLLQIVIGGLTIGFTAPSSPLRLATLFLLLLVPWRMDKPWSDVVQYDLFASFIAANGVAYAFQYLNTALITSWDFQHAGPSTPDPYLLLRSDAAEKLDQSKGTQDGPKSWRIWERLRFGYNAMTDFRRVDTPWEARNVPPFSYSNPDYVPTKSRFLMQRAANVIASYFILDLMKLRADTSMNATLFSPEMVPIFRRLDSVKVQELALRLAITVFTWISSVCVLTALSSILAIASVGTGLTEPRAWRPVFGSLSSAYSLRRLWGTFWHQLNRLKVTGPASYLVYYRLRFRKGGLVGQYLFILISFLLTGLEHLAGDRAEGLEVYKSGSLEFFLTQALGIVLEDLVQRVWTRLGGRRTGNEIRALGYVWVTLFQMWTVPALIYPHVVGQKGIPRERILPFSLLGWLIESRS